MKLRTAGRIVAELGVAMLVLSLAANPLRIGSNPDEFGWLQMLGAFLGAAVAAVGLWYAVRKD
jgi:hypothetical protein